MVRVEEIKPAAVNDKLYRPIDPNDPELLALASSISDLGIQEPLVLTTDNVILSGHRRFAAAKIAGLSEVPTRCGLLKSTDAQFLTLLREHNRQRCKTLPEQFREKALDALSDPGQAYRRLVDHRKKAAKVNIEQITIEGIHHRSQISGAKQPMVDAVKSVIEENRDYLPMSNRAIHYRLLNSPPLRNAKKKNSKYRNDLQSYKDLCNLLTRMRLEGNIPFEVIADDTRPNISWEAHKSAAAYLGEQLANMFRTYARDNLQGQTNHVEIVGEKLTIEPLVKRVAGRYGIPVLIGRGYSSLPPRVDMAKRFRLSGAENLVILFVSDFDPEGRDIAHSFAKSMKHDLGVEKIIPVQAALKDEHIKRFNLVPQMKAKAGSSRRQGFVDKYGDDVFELESLSPSQLEVTLVEAIEGVLDMNSFHREQDEEKKDAAKIEAVRVAAIESISSVAEDFNFDMGSLDD